MKFRETLSRITGLSVPVFGISWTPAVADVTVARRVVAFLEDRRVLFNPFSMEDPRHCIDSVIEIRKFLTNEIGAIPDADNPLAANLRAMRAACRKFVDLIGERPEHRTHGMEHGHWASWGFGVALGELRGVIGIHLASVAARYGLDIEDDLAEILPVVDSGGSRALDRS
jgi:hypothetical protein